MPRLVVTDGRNVLGTFRLEKPCTLIGRSTSADVPLDDLTVSRRHAEIRCTGASWFVSNLAGQNGVFVGGRWIDTHKLADGDVIEISRYRLRFEAPEAQQRSPAAEHPSAEDSFRITPGQVHRAVGRTDPDDVVAQFEQQRRAGRPSKLDSRQQTHMLQPAELQRTRERLEKAARAQVRAVIGGGMQTFHLDEGPLRIGSDPTCQARLVGGWASRGVSAAPHALRDQEFFEVDGVRFQFLDRV